MAQLHHYKYKLSNIQLNTIRQNLQGSQTQIMSQSLITTKRQYYQCQIRRESLRIHMHQIRQQLLTTNRADTIVSLYHTITTTKQVTPQQIQILLQYINQDSDSNAIIVLGNLIIDGIVIGSQVGKRLMPGVGQYWGWILRVLLESMYCESRFVVVSMDAVAKHANFKLVSVGSLYNHLLYIEALLRTREQEIAQTLSSQPSFTASLLNLINHSQKNIYSLAISILARIIRTIDPKQIFRSKNGLSMPLKSISKHFQKILIKSQPQLRGLGVQILTNLAFNQILFAETTLLILSTSLKEKLLVRVQISYYWLAIVWFCCQKDLILGLLDRGFRHVLVQSLKDDKKIIRKNAKQALQIIVNRFVEWNLKGQIEWVRYGFEEILQKVEIPCEQSSQMVPQ